MCILPTLLGVDRSTLSTYRLKGSIGRPLPTYILNGVGRSIPPTDILGVNRSTRPTHLLREGSGGALAFRRYNSDTPDRSPECMTALRQKSRRHAACWEGSAQLHSELLFAPKHHRSRVSIPLRHTRTSKVSH